MRTEGWRGVGECECDSNESKFDNDISLVRADIVPLSATCFSLRRSETVCSFKAKQHWGMLQFGKVAVGLGLVLS